jgi:hypothetical protein
MATESELAVTRKRPQGNSGAKKRQNRVRFLERKKFVAIVV